MCARTLRPRWRTELIDLGQKSIHLSVKNRDPKAVLPFFKELKDPEQLGVPDRRVPLGRRRTRAACMRPPACSASTSCEQQIRAVFWMTPNEISKLTHAVPDLWAYRHRVIEFVEVAQGRSRC